MAYDQAVRSLSALTGDNIKPLNHPEHNEHISDVHERVQRHLGLLSSNSNAGSTLASTVTVDAAAEPSVDSSSAFVVSEDPLLADGLAMAPLYAPVLSSPLLFQEQLPWACGEQGYNFQQAAVSPSASAVGTAADVQQVPAAFYGAVGETRCVSALQYGRQQQQQQALGASALQYEQQQQHIQIWQGPLQQQQQQHAQIWQGQMQQQQEEEDQRLRLEGFNLLPGAMDSIADAGIAAVLADFLADDDVPAPNEITRVSQQLLHHQGFGCSDHGPSTAPGAGVCDMDMPAVLQQQQHSMQVPVVGGAAAAVAAASQGMQHAVSSGSAATQQQQECEHMQSCSTQSAGAAAAVCLQAAARFAGAVACCCDGPPLQQQGHGKPRLSTAAEVISFVDLSVVHLLQLYGRVTLPKQQHAGLTAVTWLAGVRSTITSTGPLSSSSSPAEACEAVPSAVLHTCVSLVSLAAGDTSTQPGVQTSPDQQSSEPFSCSFLAAVVEQLMQALLTLRAIYAAANPSERRSSKELESFKAELRAQANSAAAHAADRLLDWL